MMFKIKQLLFLLLLIFISTISYAQKPQEENSTCVSNAEKAYREGQIEEIKRILPECLKSKSVSKETKARGYRLLTITYLYFNENDSAEYFMRKLLKTETEYKVDENQDPSEFVELYDRFRTDPILLIEGHFGVGASLVRTLNNYSLDNTANSLGIYESSIGFSAGVLFEVPLSNHISVVTGGNYLSNQYQYTKEQFDYSTLYYNEKLQWVDVPLTFKFYLSKGTFRPYIQLGVRGQYLIKAEASPSRRDSLNVVLGNQTVNPTNIDVTPQREQFNILADGCLGFNWKGVIGSGYLTGKIGYSYGLVNIANPSERYSNVALSNEYLYISNDFAIDHLSFMLGYAIPVYRPKLKKRNN